MNDLTPFSASGHRARLALLVDGTSVDAQSVSAILATCEQMGRILVKRVYGRADAAPGWARMPGFRLVEAGATGMAADDLITVEAMQLAMAWQADTIVIASTGGNYTLLAEHLHEAGKTLVGLGQPTAAAEFRATFTRFLDLMAVPA
jgi:hypothetical protein